MAAKIEIRHDGKHCSYNCDLDSCKGCVMGWHEYLSQNPRPVHGEYCPGPGTYLLKREKGSGDA